MTNVLLSMISGLSDLLMSIIIKIIKFINKVISINLTAIHTYLFYVTVFKFHILTTFFSYQTLLTNFTGNP